MGNRSHRKTARAPKGNRMEDGRSRDSGLCRSRSRNTDGALVRYQDFPQLQCQMLSRAKLVNNRRGESNWETQKMLRDGDLQWDGKADE